MTTVPENLQSSYPQSAGPITSGRCYDWEMEDFAKRLREEMDSGLERLKEEKDSDHGFRKSWDELLETTVYPTFERAAEEIKGHPSYGQAVARRDNGGAILEIYLQGPSRASDHWLRFVPKYEQRAVSCLMDRRSSDGEEESFTLEVLTAATIEAKVLAFVRGIANHRIERRRR